MGGEDGDTILVGSMSDSNVVCSSDDEGDDWSDTTLGSNGCEEYCELDIGVSRVALHRDDPDVVYSTSSGELGSVMRSSNTGGSFQETGLTNLAYVTGGPNERSTSQAFAMGTYELPRTDNDEKTPCSSPTTTAAVRNGSGC